MSRARILITGPALRDEGGVANYYNAVLEDLRADDRYEIEYFELGSTKRSFGPLHPVADQAGFLGAVRRFRPDLVHVNPSLTLKSLVRDGLIVDQARRRGLPVIVFFRGWDLSAEQRVDRDLGWLFRATFGRASAFIVLAARFRGKLEGWGVRVPIVLETTTVPERMLDGFVIDEKLGRLRSDETLRVLFLARLEREKGVMETLEAVSQLLRRGANVSLTVAGDGSAAAEVQAFVRANAWLGDRVQLAGYVRGERKRELLASHHVYCFPSEYGEGMPNSVLEAMALGMPVVTCPTAGLADFFEDGRMGHLVSRRDADQIADKLAQLATDRDGAARIAAYNHTYACERFLSSHVAHRLAEIYARTLSASRGQAIPSEAGAR